MKAFEWDGQVGGKKKVAYLIFQWSTLLKKNWQMPCDVTTMCGYRKN